MAAQAIAGRVAMTASVWFGKSDYAKEKPASIGINAPQLVLVVTKSGTRALVVMGFSGVVKASQLAFTQ